MLRSEHSRCEGDDWIIANDGRQDELDELMGHRIRHPMESLRQPVKGKTAEGEDDNGRD